MSASGDVLEQAAERFAGRALRRDVEQVELAGPEPLDRLLAIAVRGRQRCRADADRFGAPDLVVHQRDQRRDDQCRAVAHERGQLVAERLAGTGRHHRESVLAREDAADHVLLDAAERVEAEYGFENRKGRPSLAAFA